MMVLGIRRSVPARPSVAVAAIQRNRRARTSTVPMRDCMRAAKRAEAVR
jgi:hypothetical protein